MTNTTHDRSLLSRLFGARETGLVMIILALFVIMSLASPHFLTWPNMRAMTMDFSVEAIVVVGMTILLISGGIDLSVGSVTALSMVVAGLLFLNGVNPWVAALVAIAWVFAVTGMSISAVLTVMLIPVAFPVASLDFYAKNGFYFYKRSPLSL